MASDTTDWVVERCVAAFAMLPQCTTNDRICRSRRVTRLPILLSQSARTFVIGFSDIRIVI